uniref:Putative ovule protein n=1 Tax=Solanum chacoense TaxID=4108 RepID=A0A0V0HWY6_SOLCH
MFLNLYRIIICNTSPQSQSITSNSVKIIPSALTTFNYLAYSHPHSPTLNSALHKNSQKYMTSKEENI